MIDVKTMLTDLLYEIEIGTIYSEARISLIKSYDRFYKGNGYLTQAQEKTLQDIYSEVIG